jgi:hypothetical protein
MSERERRLGLNEAVFREVNERIREVSARFEMPRDLDLVCECGRRECTERISIAITEYEQVRADPFQFMLVPGHEDETVEVVVARRGAYDVVRKQAEEAAAVAEATDPRTR